jgi:hypothetical protein
MPTKKLVKQKQHIICKNKKEFDEKIRLVFDGKIKSVELR